MPRLLSSHALGFFLWLASRASGRAAAMAAQIEDLLRLALARDATP